MEQDPEQNGGFCAASGSGSPTDDIYRDLVEQLPDYAIFCTDRAGQPQTWNRGVERLLGFSKEEFLGHEVLPQIFIESDVEAGVLAWELEEAEKLGSSSNNRWMRRKTGEHFYAMGITTALRDASGFLTGYAKIMQDRTLQHGQALDLKHKTEQLLRANEQKDRFLATLSHELRNPLAPIRSGLEVLRHSPPESEQTAWAISVLDRQTAQLTRLVDDLLDMTRITQGRVPLDLAPVCLNEIVRTVVEDHRELYACDGVRLELAEAPDPLKACGDRVRLVQVFGNLLDNALKFTPRGGAVCIDLHRAGEDGVVSITDTGAGMTPETLADVFEPFVQASSNTGHHASGLGLGLSLVKGLVESHGGAVEADSRGLGHGSRFVVTLPLGESIEQPASAEDAEDGGPRRVLIVEDNGDAAEMLSLALVLRGHTVDVADTGPDGVEKAAAFLPDVVLCDIGLPGIDGFGVARALRSQPALRGVYLVALSGHDRPAELENAFASGFDELLPKPVDLESLTRLISSVEPRPRDS